MAGAVSHSSPLPRLLLARSPFALTLTLLPYKLIQMDLHLQCASGLVLRREAVDAMDLASGLSYIAPCKY